jgi:VCBS repeat-containing protein
VADITAGNLAFTPAANANGTGYATFTFSVRDSNSTYDAAPNTLTVNVTAVNDAPVLTANTGSTVAEGGTDTIDSSELAVTDVENPAAQLTYTIGTGPAYGRLELTTAPGVSVSTFTQADIAANRLVYVHNGSETTSDNFTFTVSDGGGGTLGPTTMTLTITPVNDAPTIISNGGGTTALINVAENVSAVTIETGADVDLPAQALTYSISGGADQARFTINAATGALNFTAPPDFEVATDVNGDNVYVVQVRVVDSQGASTAQTIQVTVTDVAEGLVPPSNTPTIPPSLLPTSPLETEKRGQPVTPGRNEPPANVGTPTTEQEPKPTETTVHPSGEMMPPGTPVEAPVFIKQEDLRRYETAKLEPVMPRWDDAPAPSPFTIIPVEPELSIDSKQPDEQSSLSDVLMAKLDVMTKSLEEAIGIEQEQELLVARVAAVSGAALSVGFVAWAVRSSALLASCLATLPAWKSFDPLPIVRLSKQERNRRRQATDAVQRQEQDEFGGLGKFF